MSHPLTTWFERSRLAVHLGYRPDEPLRFLSQRLCGLWLVWIGAVIVVAALFGGAFLIHPLIFGLGYVGGMALYGGPVCQDTESGDYPCRLLLSSLQNASQQRTMNASDA